MVLFFWSYVAVSAASWWVAAVRFRRTRWAWVAALAPLGGIPVWFFGLWVWMDWEASFWAQPTWILVGHGLLVAAIAWAATITWYAGRRCRAGS